MADEHSPRNCTLTVTDDSVISLSSIRKMVYKQSEQEIDASNHGYQGFPLNIFRQEQIWLLEFEFRS